MSALKQRITAACFAVLMILLAGCAPGVEQRSEKTRYEAGFLDVFDTATTIIGYAETEEEFRKVTQEIHDELLHYHRLYDIYNVYEGINNLKTINDNAGKAPVEVEQEIIDLLLFCKEMASATGGVVNVAMGSVLSLWHDARSTAVNGGVAAVPDMDKLLLAAEHTSFDNVIIDEEASTVYLADGAMRLDVGAVAKGYAVEQVCQNAPAGLLISVGGNVCATGPKASGEAWVVGIQDPDGDGNLHTLYAEGGSIVTSGDYQRYFVVHDKIYHHIIDSDTLMPGDKWRAVTVVCPDSGVADALSTALFLMNREEGEKLAAAFDAQAMWLAHDGSEYFTSGFEAMLRN